MGRHRQRDHLNGTVVRIPYGDGRSAYGQIVVDGWLRVLCGGRPSALTNHVLVDADGHR